MNSSNIGTIIGSIIGAILIAMTAGQHSAIGDLEDSTMPKDELRKEFNDLKTHFMSAEVINDRFDAVHQRLDSLEENTE